VDAHAKHMLYDREIDQILSEAVTVNPDLIENDLVRISSDLAYFGEVHADAALAEGNAKIALRETEAKLNMLHRTTLTMQGDGKKAPTVDAVKAAVDGDPQFQDAARAYLEAEVQTIRAKSRLEAVRAKKDTCIQIAMTRRIEMGMDPASAADHRMRAEAARIHKQS